MKNVSKMISSFALILVLSFSGLAFADSTATVSGVSSTAVGFGGSVSDVSSTAVGFGGIGGAGGNAAGGSAAGGSAGSTAIIVNNESQQFLNPPTNFPYIIPMLQGGKVGDVTGLMPRFSFKVLTPYNREKDVVKGIIGTYQGWIWNRIRLDEIESELIEKAKDIQAAGKDVNKIRYQVQYKDSVTSSGIGGGLGGSLSGTLDQGNGAAGTLSVLPGTHRSTADPMYILKFFLIE